VPAALYFKGSCAVVRVCVFYGRHALSPHPTSLQVRFDDQVGAPATPGERKDQFETAAGRDEQADAGAPSTSARLQLVVGPDGEIMVTVLCVSMCQSDSLLLCVKGV